MKLVLKNDDNTEVEIKEIQTINKDCKVIILFTKTKLNRDTAEFITERLTEETGKKVLILDSCFESKIYSIV